MEKLIFWLLTKKVKLLLLTEKLRFLLLTTKLSVLLLTKRQRHLLSWNSDFPLRRVYIVRRIFISKNLNGS